MKVKSGVDCLPDYPVGSKKYICFEIAPGQHVFSVHAENLGQSVVAPVGKEITIQEGQAVYFSFGLYSGVKLMSPEQGEKLLKKYKITKNGYYKSTRETPG